MFPVMAPHELQTQSGVLSGDFSAGGSLLDPCVLMEGRTSGLQFNDRFSKKPRHAIADFFTFATSDPAEECRRRSEAINAVTALSKRQELRVRKNCRSRKTRNEKDGGKTDVDVVSAENLKTREPFPIESLLAQCIFCLGNSDLPLEYRKKTFRNREGRKRHFHRKHVRHSPDDEPIEPGAPTQC